MAAYILVRATTADYDFVYRLKKVVLKEYIEKTWGWNEDFQLEFHKNNFPTTNTKIIQIDNTRAGTVDVIEDADKIFISGLYILPEFQSKGIGSSILKKLMVCAEAGGKRIELEVLRVNVKAQRLYKRLGFQMAEKDDKKFLMWKEFV